MVRTTQMLSVVDQPPVYLYYSQVPSPWPIILTATAAMAGGTQLYEAHLINGSPRFRRTTSKCRNYALFVGQIIKYTL